MSITSFVIILAFSILGVSSLIEFYKKNIRKDKAAAWENWIVGGVLSTGFSALINFTGLAFPILASKSIWLDVVLYTVVIFVAQMYVDMKFVKAIIKAAAKTSDMTALAKLILEKTGLKAEVIYKALAKLKVSEASFIKALVDSGVPEDKAAEIARVVYPVLADKTEA